MADDTALQTALDHAIAERDAWAQDAFEAKRFAAQLGIERQHLADALADAEQQARTAAQDEAALQIDAAHQERDRAFDERDRSHAAYHLTLAERDEARIARDDATAMLGRVTASTAWRMTYPARRVIAALLGRDMA